MTPWQMGRGGMGLLALGLGLALAAAGQGNRATGLAPEAQKPGPRDRQEKVRPKSYTYKTVANCEIKADVYGGSGTTRRPVVIWIHGGALIMGHRGQVDQALLAKLLKAGYVVVSLDYRLAPETKLPAILEDLQDGCRWVRDKGPQLFPIDRTRLGVMGASAGGYLTLAAGFRVQPRPSVLVSLWGYGDIAGPWYSRPDPFYCRLPPVPSEEAYQAVGGPVLAASTGRNNRYRFYLYCRQHGLWPKEVTGHDPVQEPRAFDAFCPLRNVTAEYPPTLLIHGTTDTDVPCEQSELMAKELRRKGVEHALKTIPGAGHGLAGAGPAVLAQTQDRILAFLNKYLR